MNSTSFQFRRASTHRHKPVVVYKVIVHSDGREQWVPKRNIHSDPAPASIKVILSENGAESKLDIGNWLKNALARWSENEISISFVCFDFAIVRTNLLQHLSSLNVKHRWKIMLYTDGKDFTSTSVLDKLLQAPVDELYIYPSDLGSEQLNPRILEVVKDLVDLRNSRMQNKPFIVCRMSPENGKNPRLEEQISQWSRQINPDRFEISTLETEEERLWGL